MRKAVTSSCVLLLALAASSTDGLAQPRAARPAPRRTLAQPLVATFQPKKITPKVEPFIATPSDPVPPAIDCAMVVKVDGSTIDPNIRVVRPSTDTELPMRVIKPTPCPAKR